MNLLAPSEVADKWAAWCGETPWSSLLRQLDGQASVKYYGGLPQSASAIPLCFTVVMNDGTEYRGSRLKDIKAAIAHSGEQAVP